MRAYIGDFGHFLIIISFVSSLLSGVAYTKSSLNNDKGWLVYGRSVFYLHGIAVLGVVVSLFVIIYNHYYEYHYAWSHSSNYLPVHYMISCFWEGQEGSFLLWVYWQMVIGLVIIKKHKEWEASVMAIFCLVQAFLASMILGVVLFDIKIGSSPFISLLDAMPNAPIFKTNPDFIPEDGTGLNPLLQNYWMVIHPPTLFLGFATTLVPFAFCIAGLWKKDYLTWVKPALVWMLFSCLVLGMGIMMGAYWAYETLNFGGYWNWDPVENAVYVPWLIGVAAVHTMAIYKKKGTALKTTIVLVCMTFILVLYSTFLTRSGILGEASVHSFTDLGLSGQLLIYLLAFILITVVLVWRRWGHLPKGTMDLEWNNREFWLFVSVIVLSIAAFQVIMATSIPVFNTVKGFFGEKGRMAPPADQIGFYSKFQIWPAIVVLFGGAIGQYIWWKSGDKRHIENMSSKFFMLLGVLGVASLLLIISMDYNDGILEQSLAKIVRSSGVKVYIRFLTRLFSYVLLLTGSLFSILISVHLFKHLMKQQINLIGGVLTHTGLALMLLGILFSSGYSKVVSLNRSGLLYSKQFPEEMNLENVLVWRNQPLKMGKYELNYKGPKTEPVNLKGYINSEYLWVDKDKHFGIANKDFDHNELDIHKGDTIDVYPENTYYQVKYTDEAGTSFDLFPRAQVNPNMGLLASPDIRHLWNKDLYTYIASVADPGQEIEWSDTTVYTLALEDTAFFNDFIVQLDSVKRVANLPGARLTESDIAVQAYFTLYGPEQNHMLAPIMLIRNSEAYISPVENRELGLKLSFINVDPKTGRFTFALCTSQKEYIILKVLEKPFVSFVWLGTIVCLIGFGVAMNRRIKEKH